MMTFNATVVRATARALLLSVEFGFCDGVGTGAGSYRADEWFPKSQTKDNGDGTFTVPTWLGRKKGLGERWVGGTVVVG